VVEVEAAELVFEAAYCVAVCLHLHVVAAGLFHRLVDDELRVSPHIEAFDADLDGDVKTAEVGLVLRHVVGRREVESYHVAHMYSKGQDEKKANTCAGFHH
jgi:hypothetical protein